MAELTMGMEPVEEVVPKIYGRLHMIAYCAALDIPRELVQFTAKLLAAERRRRGAGGQRTCSARPAGTGRKLTGGCGSGSSS
jgi:hypothetical protein